eukprot:4429233-Pleurochrysis_carterae.AAC.4
MDGYNLSCERPRRCGAGLPDSLAYLMLRSFAARWRRISLSLAQPTGPRRWSSYLRAAHNGRFSDQFGRKTGASSRVRTIRAAHSFFPNTSGYSYPAAEVPPNGRVPPKSLWGGTAPASAARMFASASAITLSSSAMADDLAKGSAALPLRLRRRADDTTRQDNDAAAVSGMTRHRHRVMMTMMVMTTIAEPDDRRRGRPREASRGVEQDPALLRGELQLLRRTCRSK